MIRETDGYQLVQPTDRLNFIGECFTGIEVPVPGIGSVQLSGSRAHGYEFAEPGVKFTRNGILFIEPAVALRNQGLYDTGVSLWSRKGDERYPLVTRVVYAEESMPLASVIEGKGDWWLDFDELGRSFACTGNWEMMEKPERFIWFTDPRNLIELSKLRFFFS